MCDIESKFAVLICNSPEFLKEVKEIIDKLLEFQRESEQILAEAILHTTSKDVKVLTGALPRICDEMVQKLEGIACTPPGDRAPSTTSSGLQEQCDECGAEFHRNLGEVVRRTNSFPILLEERAKRKFVNEILKQEKLQRVKVAFEKSQAKLSCSGGRTTSLTSCSDAFSVFLDLLRSATVQFQRRLTTVQQCAEKKEDLLEEVRLNKDKAIEAIQKLHADPGVKNEEFQEQIQQRLAKIYEIKSDTQDFKANAKQNRIEIVNKFCEKQSKMTHQAKPLHILLSDRAEQEQQYLDELITSNCVEIRNKLQARDKREAVLREKVKAYDSEMMNKASELEEMKKKLLEHEKVLSEWQEKISKQDLSYEEMVEFKRLDRDTKAARLQRHHCAKTLQRAFREKLKRSKRGQKILKKNRQKALELQKLKFQVNAEDIDEALGKLRFRTSTTYLPDVMRLIQPLAPESSKEASDVMRLTQPLAPESSKTPESSKEASQVLVGTDSISMITQFSQNKLGRRVTFDGEN